MENPLNQSSTASYKHFIPQSPATNTKKKEISRWQQRQSTNANQMSLLSNIESYFEQQQEPQNVNVNANANMADAEQPEKATRFLRKGGGTVNKRNKYLIEQEKRAERKRIKQLGLTQNKPKTQKTILMEQWREKMKKKDKSRKKKEQITKTAPIYVADHAVDVFVDVNNVNNNNYNNDNEHKQASINNDELASASKFEDLSQFDHINQNQIEEKQENHTMDTQVGVWREPKLPKTVIIAPPQKGYNFARQRIVSNDRKQRKIPTYSHHHHTSLYGNNKNKIATANRIKTKYFTVNSMSKRDRLAAKSKNRNNSNASAAKEYISKTNELKETISKYEGKCHSAEVMKQSSLESFRKYQSLIHEKESVLDEKQKVFEKYKKKQERILCQKSAEIEKRSRALLNIPDRKQRTQIEGLKKEITDLKAQFIEKEKRYKSKIERLKKQNKKINFEKIELQNEMKKFEKERLEQMEKIKNIQTTQTRKKKKYSISKIQIRPKTQQHQMQQKPQKQQPKTMINRSTNNLYQRYENQAQTQSTNNIQILSPYNVTHDNEYDSTSSESSSCSDNSTKNGEDKPMASKQEEAKEKEEENKNINYLPDVPPEYDPNTMSREQINCESVKNRESPLERMQHPDGKLEQVYCDGSKLILFPNQTEKYIFANLRETEDDRNNKRYKQIYVKFPNGDVKKILSDGCEVYYYSKNNIIHASKTDGIQLFFFSSQHEVHFPDKTKHILFADGTKKYIYPNGDEQCVFQDENNTNQSQ